MTGAKLAKVSLGYVEDIMAAMAARLRGGEDLDREEISIGAALNGQGGSLDFGPGSRTIRPGLTAMSPILSLSL